MEFAYASSINQTTGCSPFEAIYGENLIGPLNLVQVKTSLAMTRKKGLNKSRSYIRCERALQLKMQSILSKLTDTASLLSLKGDLVWVHLRKDRFPTKNYNKLKPPTTGPIKFSKRKHTRLTFQQSTKFLIHSTSLVFSRTMRKMPTQGQVFSTRGAWCRA